MDPETLIFDISSDEEFGFDSNPSSTVDDFGWISKILEDLTNGQDSNNVSIDKKIDDVNVNVNVDVDDDVVVVGEVIVNPKRAKRSFQKVDSGGGDDDDDCVVLECDPDKPVLTSKVGDDDGKDGGDDDDDDDELMVVGEKGQVACRDFPHSRHLCLNFPFSSTSHESRCDLCHCYVCDSLAPCPYWGSGTLTTDHCHATDKPGYWQIERQKFRQLKNPSLQISKPNVLPAQLPQAVQASPRHHFPHRVPSTCVNSPFGPPNIGSRGRSYKPNDGQAAARNRYRQHLISRQLVRTCSRDTQGSQLAPRMTTSRPVFKRSAITARSGVPSRVVTVAYSQPPRVAAKPIENHSSNLQDSSPRLVMHPMRRQSNARTSTSHLPGYGLPSPHAPTSISSGWGQPSAVVGGSQYTNSLKHHAQSIASPLIHCNNSNALNRASQSTQQHSVETQSISYPNFSCTTSDIMPSNITQWSHQASGVSEYHPSNPCSTLNAPNSVAQNPAGAETGMDDSLPSIENNSRIGLDFDVNGWLDETVEDRSFFDLSSQASQSDPIDTGMLYFDFETSWQGLAQL